MGSSLFLVDQVVPDGFDDAEIFENLSLDDLADSDDDILDLPENPEVQAEEIVVRLGSSIVDVKFSTAKNAEGVQFESADQWQERLARCVKLSDGRSPGLFTAAAKGFDMEILADKASPGSELLACITKHSHKIPAFLKGMCFCNGDQLFISEEIFHGTNPLKLKEIYGELLWLHFANPYFKGKKFVFIFFDPVDEFDQLVFSKRRAWSIPSICKLGNFYCCTASDLGYFMNFGGPIYFRRSRKLRKKVHCDELVGDFGTDFLISTVLKHLRGVPIVPEERVKNLIEFLVERENNDIPMAVNPSYHLLAAKKFIHEDDGRVAVTISWMFFCRGTEECKFKIFCEADRANPKIFPGGPFLEAHDVIDEDYFPEEQN